MEFVDRVFVDDDITLDGNSFTRCAFDGCVLRYNGGPLEIVGGLRLRTESYIVMAEHLDPLTNPLAKFIIGGIEAQGGTRLTEQQIAAQKPITPKKDTG